MEENEARTGLWRSPPRERPRRLCLGEEATLPKEPVIPFAVCSSRSARPHLRAPGLPSPPSCWEQGLRRNRNTRVTGADCAADFLTERRDGGKRNHSEMQSSLLPAIVL